MGESQDETEVWRRLERDEVLMVLQQARPLVESLLGQLPNIPETKKVAIDRDGLLGVTAAAAIALQLVPLVGLDCEHTRDAVKAANGVTAARAEELEQQAEAFNARYGVGTPEQPAWSDEALDQALADHGLPALSVLAVQAESEVRVLARERAAHLLGHLIASHPQSRCRACERWGTPTEGMREV